MSKLVPYAIINPAAGYPAKILRAGLCQPAVRDGLARPGELMLPIAADHRRQAIQSDGTPIDLPETAPLERAPDPVEVLLEALKKKGLEVSPADLKDAAADVVKKRRELVSPA